MAWTEDAARRGDNQDLSRYVEAAARAAGLPVSMIRGPQPRRKWSRWRMAGMRLAAGSHSVRSVAAAFGVDRSAVYHARRHADMDTYIAVYRELERAIVRAAE